MKDIVERLREIPGTGLPKDAADEIERLRMENVILFGDVEAITDVLTAIIESMKKHGCGFESSGEFWEAIEKARQVLKISEDWYET